MSNTVTTVKLRRQQTYFSLFFILEFVPFYVVLHAAFFAIPTPVIYLKTTISNSDKMQFPNRWKHQRRLEKWSVGSKRPVMGTLLAGGWRNEIFHCYFRRNQILLYTYSSGNKDGYLLLEISNLSLCRILCRQSFWSTRLDTFVVCYFFVYMRLAVSHWH